MEQQQKWTRPGRKIGSERRRVARQYLREFYQTEQFGLLDRRIQLAMQQLCPPSDECQSCKSRLLHHEAEVLAQLKCS